MSQDSQHQNCQKKNRANKINISQYSEVFNNNRKLSTCTQTGVKKFDSHERGSSFIQ